MIGWERASLHWTWDGMMRRIEAEHQHDWTWPVTRRDMPWWRRSYELRVWR